MQLPRELAMQRLLGSGAEHMIENHVPGGSAGEHSPRPRAHRSPTRSGMRGVQSWGAVQCPHMQPHLRKAVLVRGGPSRPRLANRARCRRMRSRTGPAWHRQRRPGRPAALHHTLCSSHSAHDARHAAQNGAGSADKASTPESLSGQGAGVGARAQQILPLHRAHGCCGS